MSIKQWEDMPPSDTLSVRGEVDLGEIHSLRGQGLIVVRKHPDNPNLLVANYSTKRRPKAGQDSPLLALSRGLIFRGDTGEIIARPFPRMGRIAIDGSLPSGSFSAYPKLDGSLAIQYPNPENGRPSIATRGSFGGDRVDFGNSLLELFGDYPFNADCTYLWEMIGPDNQHVIKYPKNVLTLLGIVVTETGAELQLPNPDEVPFGVVRKVDVTTIEELRELNAPNTEGFVLRMDETGHRFKLKFPDYEYMHLIQRGRMDYIVWTKLLNNMDMDEYILSVPVHARDAVSMVVQKLVSQHRVALEAMGIPESQITNAHIQEAWQRIKPIKNPDHNERYLKK